MRIAKFGGATLLGCALIVLVSVVVIFRREATELAVKEAMSERLHNIIDTAPEALSNLKDAETGQRGYLLTGKESYLGPWSSGMEAFERSIGDLRRLTAGDATISGLVDDIAVTGQRKVDELRDTVASARAGDRAGALRRVREDVGKMYMDQVRQLTASAIRKEEAALRRNSESIAAAQRSTRTEAVVAAALLFLLTLAGTALLSIEVRYARRIAANLEVSEAKYRDLAAGLEGQVANRTNELEKLNNELTAFAYSVSHDLRAPLRAIDGFSQMILEDYSDRLDDAGRDMLNRIRKGTGRMGSLIQSLLQLSRVTRLPLELERVSLTSMAGTVIEVLRAASPGRDVAVSIAPGMEVNADPQLMRIVMDNLLANAWKFTARTGAARIEVGATWVQGAKTFYVRDNGSGFDPSRAGRLFTPFQRLHSESEFEGTGVGLATVQRVIHRHEGRVWAESTPGNGAAFFFTLRDKGA